MRIAIPLALLFFLLLSRPAASRAADTDPAVAAARAWVALVDAGKYGESWKEAAAFFKKSVKREQWTQMVKGVREMTGVMVSRKLKSATPVRNVPNAPPGEYVVIQFDTRFKKKGASVETVTPMLDKDKKWRVSGYFIK